MTPLPQCPGTYRRRIHYVDKKLQRWLLLTLVTLEAGLVAGMVWLMHWRLGRIIDESLYRVHLATAAPLADELMHAAPVLVGIFMLANVIALLVAEGIWRSYVNSLLRSFMGAVGKTGELDFSADPQMGGRHRLLDLTAAQRSRERRRFAAFREQLARLDAEVSGACDPRAARELLERLDNLVGQAH